VQAVYFGGKIWRLIGRRLPHKDAKSEKWQGFPGRREELNWCPGRAGGGARGDRASPRAWRRGIPQWRREPLGERVCRRLAVKESADRGRDRRCYEGGRKDRLERGLVYGDESRSRRRRPCLMYATVLQQFGRLLRIKAPRPGPALEGLRGAENGAGGDNNDPRHRPGHGGVCPTSQKSVRGDESTRSSSAESTWWGGGRWP